MQPAAAGHEPAAAAAAGSWDPVRHACQDARAGPATSLALAVTRPRPSRPEASPEYVRAAGRRGGGRESARSEGDALKKEEKKARRLNVFIPQECAAKAVPTRRAFRPREGRRPGLGRRGSCGSRPDN